MLNGALVILFTTATATENNLRIKRARSQQEHEEWSRYFLAKRKEEKGPLRFLA